MVATVSGSAVERAAKAIIGAWFTVGFAVDVGAEPVATVLVAAIVVS